MILRDILEGVGLHSAHALAIHQHLGYGVALIGGEGEGLVAVFNDRAPAGGRDRAVRTCRRLDGVAGAVNDDTGGNGIHHDGAVNGCIVDSICGSRGVFPLVGFIGFYCGGIGQDIACVIHPLNRTAGGSQGAAGSGQASVCQRLAAGGDSSVLGCAGGGRSGDGDLHLCAGDAVVACIASLGGLYLYGTDLDGSQLAGGVNGRLAGAIGHSVGHGTGAGAAAGTQLQGLTVDHGGAAGEGQSRLVVLCCEGDLHIDGGILIVVGADGHRQGDGITSHTAGEGVGHLSGGIHSPAVNRHRTGLALSALGVGQCACVSGHHRADCLLAGGRGELLADRDICQREGSCLGDVHHDGGQGAHELIVAGLAGAVCQRHARVGHIVCANLGIGDGAGGRDVHIQRFAAHKTVEGQSALGETDRLVILHIAAVSGVDTASEFNILCCDLRVGDGQHLGGCQRIVAGGDGSRGKGDLICLVDIGTVVFQRTGDSEGVGTNQRPGLYRNGKASGRIGIGVVDLGNRAGMGQISRSQCLGRDGNGRIGGAVVSAGGVGDRQGRAGGIRLFHLDGRHCGVRAGDDFQNGRIGTVPAPSAAIGSGLGGSQGEVRIAIGLAGGRGGDAYACVRLRHHIDDDDLFARRGEVGSGCGVYLDVEGSRAGARVSLQLVIRSKRDAVRCAVQRVGQLCAAVGVVEGSPVGNVDFHSVLHKLARGCGSNGGRCLIDGEIDRGSSQLQIEVIAGSQ